ncbi:choice-of-anchor Q domain-containing protein [Gimesia aquarii]|uniref:Probable pectate lyase C n=1 Tax=Gimesia aquarii TaxID=2527964 RepID=A0A517X327_9PLAN|nr:choice-of-anchor Q domain-containing protein [Gimesia aquarii]QDU11902.1 hypothetical protein V202x_53270 [Gimesia aquarii]
MFRFHWLTSLRNKLRADSTRHIQSERKYARQRSLRVATAFVSRTAAERLEDRTLLTVFTVVNTNDSDTGSLREAIEQANASAGADTISFDASLAGQTIVLTDELLISDDVTIIGLGANQLTISGNNNNRIFNIDDSSTETEVIVELSGLSLINGHSDNGGAILNYENLTITDSILSGNNVAELQYDDSTVNNGGGVHNIRGALTINNSTFTNNSANDGGGVYNRNGTVTVTNSTFSENSATTSRGDGGGIYNYDGNLIVNHSTFSENSATNGAGIHFNSSYVNSGPVPNLVMDITNSTFLKNSATSGGGIYFESPYKNDSHMASVMNSTFSENIVSGNGAGIHFDSGKAFVFNSTFAGNISDRIGGGISNRWTTLTIKNSSFNQNSARLYGGGISNGGFFYYESGGNLSLINSTLSENSSSNNGGALYSSLGIVEIVNSTLSGNSAIFTGGAIYTRRFEGPTAVNIISSTITGNTANYVGGFYTSSTPFSIINSIIAGNPTNDSNPQNSISITHSNSTTSSIIQDSIVGLLDPVLRDNGGPTKTHALLPGSNAINSGDNSAIVDAEIDTDQRGSTFNRIFGGVVDLGAYEVQVFHSQIDLKVVNSKTSTLSNGESNSLPDNLGWIDEWSSYWLEIWISTPSTTDLEILSAAFNMSYNTSITTATSIEYGAAFTLNQSGTINDVTGTIQNLSAETGLSDVGDDQHVLFARIRFESTSDDAVNLDLQGRNLNPQSPEFLIGQSEIVFTGSSPIEEAYGPSPETLIYANPYDLNDDDAINFRDLMLFASVYNTIPSESSSDYSWFADLNQSDRVNFKDLVLFASNYGKRKLDHPTIVYPQNFPHAWNNQLLVDTTQGEPQLAPETLSQSTADTALNNVVEHVSPQLNPSQNETLEQIDIQVVDLEGNTLGRAVSGTIYIDANAAGYGWFVDATPGDNSEFQVESQLSLIALPETDAAGHVDLWSVIMHELGHLLGYEHEDTGLMQDTLPPGVRRLPDWELNIDLGNNSLPEEADSFFLTIQDQTNLVPF